MLRAPRGRGVATAKTESWWNLRECIHICVGLWMYTPHASENGKQLTAACLWWPAPVAKLPQKAGWRLSTCDELQPPPSTPITMPWGWTVHGVREGERGEGNSRVSEGGGGMPKHQDKRCRPNWPVWVSFIVLQGGGAALVFGEGGVRVDVGECVLYSGCAG